MFPPPFSTTGLNSDIGMRNTNEWFLHPSVNMPKFGI